MMRFLVYLVIAIALAYVATTVPLGKHTLVGHVRKIWHTEEVQELKRGVKEKAGPAVDRLERGVRAGYRAATDKESANSATNGATGDGAGSQAHGSAAEAPP